MTGFPLRVWPGRWAVCRLAPGDAVPALGDWRRRRSASSRDRRRSCRSWCPRPTCPAQVISERGFRVIEVVGPVPFAVTGLIASLSQPLAAAGISLFPVATYDTDYVLVKEATLAAAVDVLRAAGFIVE